MTPATAVTVTLYDALGRAIRVLEDGTKGAGAHAVRVAAEGLAAGVYFVEVRARTARVLQSGEIDAVGGPGAEALHGPALPAPVLARSPEQGPPGTPLHVWRPPRV